MVRVGITLGLLAFARVSAAQELANDSFVDGGNAAFQGGFITGEQAASRFVLPASGSFRVTGVKFLFGGAATTQTITLHIYTDTAGTDAPGSEIFTMDYMVTGNDAVFYLADLSQDGVTVSGTFRVGIQFQHDGLPSVARDTDGTIAADKNFIFTSGSWTRSSTLGVTGDWILRAIVQPVGATPDAGSSPDGASSQPDASTGAQCHVTSECPTGQYCDRVHMSCTYDCRIDADCASSQMCNSLGQCIARPDSGGCAVATPPSRAPRAIVLLVALILTAYGCRRFARTARAGSCRKKA
jgi:hypothetical protein